MAKYLDKLLKDFEKKSEKAVSKHRTEWEGKEEDDVYSVDIHIWRKPGMGNSLQTIMGNKISIMTATCSYLNTLLIKEVIDVKELKEMFEAVIELHNKKEE